MPNTNPSDLDRAARILESRLMEFVTHMDDERELNRFDDIVTPALVQLRVALALPRASGVPEAEAVAWTEDQPDPTIIPAEGWKPDPYHALRKIAQKVVDATNLKHDTKKEPLKYTAPYGAIAELANFLNDAPPPDNAPSGAPKAWLHTLRMELGQTDERLTFSPENPFGIRGKAYSQRFEVTSDPLYLDPPSPIASEPKDAESGEGQNIAEQAAQFLWSLLDDIDTLSDHVKGDNVTYREIAERIQRRRLEVSETDGYTVTFKAKAS